MYIPVPMLLKRQSKTGIFDLVRMKLPFHNCETKLQVHIPLCSGRNDDFADFDIFYCFHRVLTGSEISNNYTCRRDQSIYSNAFVSSRDGTIPPYYSECS